ncbi:hypothetical protein HYV44_01320 [Candidatus Microgenomates bacterium]|nr:hypothetical protein [Candidatus Microgenomates bacterium]
MNLYLFNPEARRGRAKKLEPKIKQYLIDLGATGEFINLAKKGDAGKAIKEAKKKGTDTLVAIGGDGLLYQIIQEIAHEKINLGVIPIGHSNLLAHFLGIDSWQTGCESLVKGYVAKISLGVVGGRYFTSSVEIESRERNKKKMLGLIPIPSAIQYLPATVIINSENGKLKLQSNIASISVISSSLIKKVSGKEDDGNEDEELSIFIKSKPLHSKKRAKEELTVLRGNSLEIKSESVFYIKADGEPAGKTPIKISIDKQCLRVIAPQKDLDIDKT